MLSDRLSSLFLPSSFGWRNGSTNCTLIPLSAWPWSAWLCGPLGHCVSGKEKNQYFYAIVCRSHYHNLCFVLFLAQCTSLPWFYCKPSRLTSNWTTFSANCLAKLKEFWQSTNFTSGSWQEIGLSLQLTFGTCFPYIIQLFHSFVSSVEFVQISKKVPQSVGLYENRREGERIFPQWRNSLDYHPARIHRSILFLNL